MRTNIGMQQSLHTGAGYSSERISKNTFTLHTTEQARQASTQSQLCLFRPCTAMAERSCRGNCSKRRTVILDDAPRCLDDPSAYRRPRPRAWAVPIVAGLAARGLSPVCSSIGQGDRAIRLRNFAPRAAIQTMIGVRARRGPKHSVVPRAVKNDRIPADHHRQCGVPLSTGTYAVPSVSPAPLACLWRPVASFHRLRGRSTAGPFHYAKRHLVQDSVMSTHGRAFCLPESCTKIGDLPKSPIS